MTQYLIMAKHYSTDPCVFLLNSIKIVLDYLLDSILVQTKEHRSGP